MSLTCFGQDSLSIDTRQTNGVDSIHASHTTFSSNTLEDATKAEGDSAYIKEDYAAAIQIYEALLKMEKLPMSITIWEIVIIK